MSRRACPGPVEGSQPLLVSTHVESPILSLVRTALGPDLVVERELGGGGMSRLFTARRGGHRVVVKVLARAAASSDAVCRFRREAALGARLNHPHVLPVLATGETDALLFLVMPFADGGTLRRQLLRRGPLGVAEVVRLLRPLADALAHMHAGGVVHGDVKPENVLIHDGCPVLADFGAARPITHDGDARRASAIIGTPLYMAPEQAAGAPHADPRSDIYSLAVLGYELLAGRTPFAAASPHDVLRAHLTSPVPSLLGLRADVPPALALALERALAKDPADRPASAATFRAALDRAAQTIRLRPLPSRRIPVARRAVAVAGWRAVAAGLLVPLAATLAAAAVSAMAFGGTLGTVSRAGAAPPTLTVPSPSVPAESASAPAPRRLAARSRAADVVPTAPVAYALPAVRALPTVRTLLAPSSPTWPREGAHGIALPSVFATLGAPALAAMPPHPHAVVALPSAPRVALLHTAVAPPRWRAAMSIPDRCGAV